MFICPNCQSDTSRLIGSPLLKKVVCPFCHDQKKPFSRCDLGQSVSTWRDGKGTKHRLTTGKAWEIDNRIASKDDPKKIINRITGKDAQY